MNIKTAKSLARKIGNICQQHPNNVTKGHWEALSYLRTIILKYTIKNKKS
jgi:sulfur relay (sulfurtransferase) DsrC/TusE family protein